MKGTFFRKPKAYSIFLISAILLLGVLAFYLSCTSKSPTDVTAPSTETQAAKSAKGTTQTTTSSSTTTTIRPSSSAATSSTIITSRYLTTTSTRTTTTITPEVTTSVIQPANVKFCYIIGVYKLMEYEFDTLNAKGAPTIPKKITIYNGDTVYVPWDYCLALNFYVHNVGGSPAENVKIIPLNLNAASQNIYRGASNFIELPVIPFLPNDSVCVKHPLSSFFQCGLILVNTRTAQTVAPCMTWKFKLEWKDARWESIFSFTMCWGFPNNNSVPN